SDGYYYAVLSAPAPLGNLPTQRPDGRGIAYGYNTPDRLALLGGQKAPQLFVFRAEPSDYDRHDVPSQRALLESAFAGVGWRVPAALEAARDAADFYLDALSRTRMTTFTRGRVALVGDAGYANTLGGFGTGLALVGAYVLAGELVAARGDHVNAFASHDAERPHPPRVPVPRTIINMAHTNAGPDLQHHAAVPQHDVDDEPFRDGDQHPGLSHALRVQAGHVDTQPDSGSTAVRHPWSR